MATTKQQQEFRANFNQLLTDANIVDMQKHRDITRMLNEAQSAGLATPDMMTKYTQFRNNRIAKLREQGLTDESGAPVMKQDYAGRTVQARGQDLFLGGQYRPDLGVQGVLQGRQQQIGQLRQDVGADLQRLEAARKVINDFSIGGVGQKLGAGLTAAGRGIVSGLQATTGLGAPTPEELRAQLVGGDINNISAETALAELSKPSGTGGFRFAQGLGATLGGTIGSEVGAAGLAATTFGASKLAPWLIPLVAAGSSFAGGAVANKLSEAAMREAYGDRYEEVLGVLAEADAQSGGAALAGELGNVLLQGAPTLASGIGGRQTLGTIGKGVFGGQTVQVIGSAEQLGAGSASRALADAAELPAMAASPNKFDSLISNFLTKYGATATSAAERNTAYKIFEPLQPRQLPGAGFLERTGEKISTVGKRIGQFSEFARDTPGISEYLADAIGEQAVNFGQAAADYQRQYAEAQALGKAPPSAMEALTNLAFGSLFIGNNKFTGAVSSASRAVGSGALDLAARIPGVDTAVGKLRENYAANQLGVMKAFTDSGNKRAVLGKIKTDYEIESGVRKRIGIDRPTSAGFAQLAPDEIAYSLGDGNAVIYNKAAGSTRIAPHAEIFGGINDAATVEAGTAMANALAGIPTTKAQTGLKAFANREKDVVAQVGVNKQQIIGPIDTGHVIVRETPPVDGQPGITPIYSILRVSDLEEGNQEAAAKMLGDSGIEISDEPTTTVAEDGSVVQKDLFHIAAEQQFLTQDLAQYDAKTAAAISKEFPTLVQFDENLALRGRVLGIEENGDIKFQPMSLSMAVMRVPGVNVLKKGKSPEDKKTTITSALQPVSIKDLIDEQSLSASMRPTQTAKFDPLVEDADGNSERGLYTVSVDGNKQAVMLTPDQLSRVAELRRQIKDEVANVRLTTTNPNAISTALDKAKKKAIKGLFGEDGIPFGTDDYAIGSLIQVSTPDGEQRGVVIDNTSYGPAVILDDSDGKPVVVQQSQIIAGESTPKPERPSAPTAEPLNIPSMIDDEGDMFTVATKYRGDDRIAYLSQKIDEMNGESPSVLATDVFGMEMDGGRVVGTKAEVTGKYQAIKGYLEAYAKRIGDTAVKAEMERLGTVLFDMAADVKSLDFIKRIDLKAERQAAKKAEEEAERAAGRATPLTVPTLAGAEDNVFENFKLTPRNQRGQFVAPEIEDIFDRSSTDGVVNADALPSIAQELFGFSVSEKDGVVRLVGTKEQLNKRYESFTNAIREFRRSPDASPEFKANAQAVIDKLFSMVNALKKDMPFVTKGDVNNEIKAAEREAKAAERAARPAVPEDEGISFDFIKDMISDLKAFGGIIRKGEYIKQVLTKKNDAGEFIVESMSPEEAAEKVFGHTVNEGRVIGDANTIKEAYASLKNLINTNNARTKVDPAFKAEAPRMLSVLEKLQNDVLALPSITKQDFKRETESKETAKNLRESADQADAARTSEQARTERRVTVTQAQAIQGLINSVRDADGKVIPVIETSTNAAGAVTSRNLAQAIIRKVANGKGDSLLQREVVLMKALDMPPFSEKEWWRNAFQGVMYLNDRRGALRSAVEALVDLTIEHKANRRGQPLMLDTISQDVINADQRNALNQAGFINNDGSIDMSGIVIHGATERGIRFGVLNQMSSSEDTLLPPTPSDSVMNIAMDAVSSMSWGYETTTTFTTEKPKNRSEFEAIVKKLISRSKDRTDAAKKAQAVAELFDTLSHAAVKRRVQLMMEAAEKGYFTTRSEGAERFLSPTRGQRISGPKFDSYLESELRPLYNALVSKLGLSRNTDVARYLTTRDNNRDKQQQIAAALVEIIDTQLETFYQERFPAFANFDTIPDIADTAGAFVQIYDPDKQVAANIVMAFKAADVSTMVHEIAHAFFEALPEDMQSDLSSALGHTLRIPTVTHASVLTYEAQEKFAYGLEMALANFRIPTDWRGTNAGRTESGATKALTKVLEGAAEAVRSSFDILTDHGILKVQDGKYTGKEWQIPYTAKPKDGNLQNPNGTVYLWKGAPVILHDGTYAKINQRFGTTRNGQREVEIIRKVGESTTVVEKIKVGNIKAIGGPAEGLSPTAMSVLSIWIGQRRADADQGQLYRLGLENSTPAERAKWIQRDPKTGRIFVSRRDIGMATGDISNENIQQLLNSIGLPRVKAIQLQAIRERVGTEELKRLIENQKNIAREFMKNRPGIINFEDNALRALTREYASAVLYSRMYDLAQQGNPFAISGIKGYNNPRNYGGRGAFNAAHQAVMEVIFANRAAMESADTQVRAIADNLQNQNWRIKQSNGKPMYDPRTGELVIEKIKGAVGRKTVVGEYRVNLKTGVVIIPPGAQPFIAPDQKWIETDTSFPDKAAGGKLTDINQRASEALKKVGLSGINSVRATSPEFFIARALVENNKDMFLGNVPAQPPTVLSQVTDVTTMMQRAEPEGVRNEPLAEDTDTKTRDLYTKDVATNVGTSPNITEKPLYQMTEDEYNDSVFQLETKSYPKRRLNVPARFIRFGMPDKDANGKYKPSTNWVKLDSKGRPTKEKGISVYRAWKDPVTGKYVLESPKGPNLGTQGELIGRIEDGLKIYEFAGETKGNVGADREHVILPQTARLVGEIAPNDVVTEEDPWWTLAGTNLSESETPNWDRVKPLPSQAVAIYAAQKAGLPVNQESLKRWETSRQWDILTASEGRAYIDMSLATDMDLYDVEARVKAMSRLDAGDAARFAQGMTYTLNNPVVATNNPDSVFQVDISDPINLGNTNLGVSMAFNSASQLFRTGTANEYVARLRQLDNVTKDITDNTFDDVKATGGFDLTASIAAGDTKPHYTGSVTVKQDSFRGVLARAAYMARKMAQPNVHITSDAGNQEFGVSIDGANVVPSLTFPINEKVSDAITLRAFAESMPSVLNGAIYNSGEGTLTVYAVPEKFMMRAEAKDWTKNAKDAAREFFFTTDDGSVKEPRYTEGRLKLWNLGSSEFGAQGRFIPYETVLDIVSTVSPYDSVLDQTAKVTESTQRRLRGDVQDALTFVFGKDVKLPADAKFRREFIPAPVQQQMANHYGMMPVTGFKTDKNVIPAYKALQNELDRQFKALKLNIDFMPEAFEQVEGEMVQSGYSDMYQGNTAKGARDVASGHLYIYPTTPETFGNNKEVLDAHPLYEDSPYKTANGQTLKWNDVLRAVHDAISHGVYAVNLSPSGQDMAYVTHAMITQDPMAVWALANETRMQNMWKSANDTVYTASGQPYTMPDTPPVKLEYKFSLPVYESVYTGVSSVDDKLRAFGTQLGDYAGTLSMTAEKGEQTFYGVGNNRSAFTDGTIVQIKDPSMKGKAVFDLKNGTVRTSEDLPTYRVDDSTLLASTTPTAPTPTPTPAPATPADATADVAATVADTSTIPTTAETAETPAAPAAPAVVVSARQTRQEPGALRFLYMVNQLLKLGASGDASPVLMQNFPMANILENPDMFIRQLGLQAQVVFNPNTGFHLKDGRIINSSGMRGRKLFHEVLTKEVRSRNTYEMAKNSGLSLAAADADKLLEEARAKDPNATWDNVDDLGYNTDISTDGEFMKHLPGQGQSERFYAMSKDLVKMRQFDDMVHHLIALGYNPTPWTDENGDFIKSPFNRALKDISHLLNVIAGDIKVHDIDETDESIMRLGKFLLYSPRWLSSRLLLDDFGRFMFKGVAKAFGPRGEAYAQKVLELNGMTPERLRDRDKRVGAMHARLLNKSWLLWLGLIGLIYGVKATNPRTMEVTVDKFGARMKIGDYSFRAPGAVMTHIELSTSIGQAVLEWQAQKGATTDKPLYTIVGEKLNSVLLSRASPVLGLAGSIVTGRDTQGAPAFVSDEAVKVFWKDAIGPELERMGIKGNTDMTINKAIAERMLWWWARDAMEMYADQRKFGVTTSEALLKAAGMAAISSQGGRAIYVPKELDFERKAAERMEAPIKTGRDLFTGVEARPIVTDYLEPVKGTNYTDEVDQPFFGATGTDFEDETLFPRDLGF